MSERPGAPSPVLVNGGKTAESPRSAPPASTQEPSMPVGLEDAAPRPKSVEDEDSNRGEDQLVPSASQPRKTRPKLYTIMGSYRRGVLVYVEVLPLAVGTRAAHLSHTVG